jgi:hypothetical protein
MLEELLASSPELEDDSISKIELEEDDPIESISCSLLWGRLHRR